MLASVPMPVLAGDAATIRSTLSSEGTQPLSWQFRVKCKDTRRGNWRPFAPDPHRGNYAASGSTPIVAIPGRLAATPIVGIGTPIEAIGAGFDAIPSWELAPLSRQLARV